MEVTLRLGGHGRLRLHGVLISAAIYTVLSKSALCMGVELSLAVRDHRAVGVFENMVPMIFCLFDDAVGSSDHVVSHGKGFDGSVADRTGRTVPKFS